ncbi:MAG: hypothetical protein II306_10900 [Clostridia bacterium]|nr:hypothetical protein [Clostridia bacterium]
MEEIANTLTVLKTVEIVLSLVLIPLAVAVVNLLNGMKCQLRSEMLRIYYEHKDEKKIRQFELENFIFLFKAYRSLRGNSFVCKLYKEVMEEWEVLE